jgi:phosphoribosylglycinamide formyltransferase-1
MKKIVIFISGRGSNMKRIVKETQEGILKGIAEVVLVFSDKLHAEGLIKAKKNGIETKSISAKGKKRKEFDRELMKLLDNYDFDYIILAGFMRILSDEFVKKYPKRIINIHPADTRKHQGLGAYEWAFENNLPKTMITVHYVDQGVDTGEIIAQKEVDLSETKTLKEVEQRGLAVEHEFYSKTLLKLLIQ